MNKLISIAWIHLQIQVYRSESNDMQRASQFKKVKLLVTMSERELRNFSGKDDIQAHLRYTVIQQF
jgi:hypothetical protein